MCLPFTPHTRHRRHRFRCLFSVLLFAFVRSFVSFVKCRLFWFNRPNKGKTLFSISCVMCVAMLGIAFKQRVNLLASQPANQLADMKTSPEKRVDIIEHSFFHIWCSRVFFFCCSVFAFVDCMIQMINRNGNSTYKQARTHARNLCVRARVSQRVLLCLDYRSNVRFKLAL